MKDGIYFGLPEVLYFDEERIGSTELRTLSTDPSKFWFESYLNPLRKQKKDKPALNDGKIFHKLLLEGQEGFERDCVIAPRLHPLTKEFKAWKENQVKQIVSESDYNEAKIVIDYLKQGTIIDSVLTGGFPEVSILWTDDNGMKRRSRIDYLTENSLIDLKTFTDWKEDERSLNNYFWNYKVFAQLMDYHDALKAARYLPVIKGSVKQKKFWESIKANDKWLLMTCFVNREYPKMIIKTMIQADCPDLWRYSDKLRQQAMDNYKTYSERFGLNQAWIVQQDPQTIRFTDSDFPQLMSAE